MKSCFKGESIRKWMHHSFGDSRKEMNTRINTFRGSGKFLMGRLVAKLSLRKVLSEWECIIINC